MAIKRVLLPVSPDKSFEALSGTAFHIGDKFSAQAVGLYVQGPALVIPMFNDPASVEEVRTIAKSAQEGRREAAAKAESMFKAAASAFHMWILPSAPPRVTSKRRSSGMHGSLTFQ